MIDLKCPICKGTGYDPEDPEFDCPECEGTGMYDPAKEIMRKGDQIRDYRKEKL